MRYLLDELIAYEDGFGDILMTDRAMEHHETFMGSQNSLDISQGVDVRQKDLQWLEANMLQQFRSMLDEKLTPPSGRLL
jgi:hypothetical protein